MVLQDIALFKNFIEKNTLREIFIRAYKKSASYAKNPTSIEEYLTSVKAEDVITKGIKLFTANSTFGYDFWQNTSENWLSYLKQGRNFHSYSDCELLIELGGPFNTLRENWDSTKSWKFEDVNVALKRLGLLEDHSEEKEEEFEGPEEDTSDTEDYSGVPEADDELEFFDLSAGSRKKSIRIKKGYASLNFRNKGYRLSFSQEDTKRMKVNMYKYVRLARNKQGDIVLQLHKVENPQQQQINVNYVLRKGSNYYNASINSKDLCTKLKTLLNLTGDYFILKVEELYMDYDKANYKISK